MMTKTGLEIEFPRKLASLIAQQLFQTQGHKGHYGRIGVVGGSFQYTGAPYYAAISSLKSGADLSMIFCHKDAGIPIKSYSPENMVIPLLGGQDLKCVKILEWLKSVHAMVIGPGLGRQTYTHYQASSIMSELHNYNQSIVVIGDADFLYFLSLSTQLADIIRGMAERVVLTPNVREFQRLFEFVINRQPFGKLTSLPDEIRPLENKMLWKEDLNNLTHPYFKETIGLAASLGNCYIFRKGAFDFITNGKAGIIINSPGSKKRCGGIGDILTGVIASFTRQTQLYLYDKDKDKSEYMLRALAGASLVTRLAARQAEMLKGVSLVAPDIIEALGGAVAELLKKE